MAFKISSADSLADKYADKFLAIDKDSGARRIKNFKDTTSRRDGELTIGQFRKSERIKDLQYTIYYMERNLEKEKLATIMAISSVMIVCSIKDGHDWGDDFSLYIAQAKSIINLSINELYSLNKYSMQNSEGLIGPYLYPFGFPLLLSPAYYFFGMNFFLMKGICGLFLVLSIPMTYRLFKNRFSNSFYPFCIIMSFGFHSGFITFSNNILSDLPFFFFSNLSLMLITKRNTQMNQIILGSVIFLSYLIRDIGIVLVPTLLAYQIHVFYTKKETRKLFNFLTPHIVFILFLVIIKVLLPPGAENHYSELLNSNTLSNLINNLFYYKELVTYHFFKTGSSALFWILFFTVILGMIKTWKQNFHFIVYTILICIVLFIWPAQQGIRFIFPILPIIFYFILKGTMFLWENVRLKESILRMILFVFFMIFLFMQIRDIVMFNRWETNESYTHEMIKIYHFISENIPKKEIIVFNKPRALRLFTDRNAISVNQIHFAESKANYLLIQKQDTLNERTKTYKEFYETENFILFKRKVFGL